MRTRSAGRVLLGVATFYTHTAARILSFPYAHLQRRTHTQQNRCSPLVTVLISRHIAAHTRKQQKPMLTFTTRLIEGIVLGMSEGVLLLARTVGRGSAEGIRVEISNVLRGVGKRVWKGGMRHH